jgi:hypothetical protein
VFPEELVSSYNESMFPQHAKFRLFPLGSWLSRLVVIGCFLFFALSSQGQSAGQIPSQPAPGQMPSGPVTPGEPRNPMEDKMLHQRLKSLNEQRQKQLVDDTNRLLALATELKKEVDKSNKDTLSISVIRKAEQIEKLAKSVKDKMKAEPFE